MNVRMCLMAAAAITVASCSPPPPPISAAPLAPTLTIQDQPDRPQSGLLETSGIVSLATEPSPPGSFLIRIPFKYRHTAVLVKDLIGYSFTVRGVQAPAGSPGYLVGRFSRNSAYRIDQGAFDMWCFLPSLVGGKRKSICLLRDGTGIAAIAPTGANPYVWHSFKPKTGSFDYVIAPEFDVREVPIPLELKLEYRLDGWTASGAIVTEFAGGESSRKFVVPFGSDGIARIKTFAGELRITRSDGSNLAKVAWAD